MSTEVVTIIIAIVTASIALGGLIVRGQNHLREDIRHLREQIGGLRERMAKLEGLVEGLRELIVGRRADDSRPMDGERRVAEQPEGY